MKKLIFVSILNILCYGLLYAWQEAAFIGTNANALGLSSEAKSIKAETVLCSSENAKMMNAFADDAITASISTDGINTVYINDTEYDLKSGITGSSNPMGLSITTPPEKGWVFKIDVKKDGWITVFGKFSSNKPYYVYEVDEFVGTLITYDLGMYVNLDGQTKVHEYTLPGDEWGFFSMDLPEADKYSDGYSIRWPEKIWLDVYATDVKKNGFGYISFPVYADAGEYLICSQGSKMNTNGYIFTDKRPVNIAASGSILQDDGSMIETAVQFRGFNESINSKAPIISVSGTTVTITSEETVNTQIYYTLDGTSPTTSSNLYTAPFGVTHNCIIKAIAKTNGKKASTVSACEVNQFYASAPTFSFADDMLTITSSTPNSTIYYTLGGETPTNKSKKYTSPISISDSRVVKAIAYADNFNPSTVSTFTPGNYACQDVNISVNGEIATMYTNTPGATIRYTIDGSQPNQNSTVYTEPIILSHNCVIKAYAHKDYMDDSRVSVYNVATFYAQPPTFKFSNDKLAISCETPNAKIYYTLGGDEPTNASTQYTAPLSLTDNRVVKAVAYADDFNPSQITSYTPNSFNCQEVEITLEGDNLIMRTSTAGASIYYTLDGTTPDKQSSLYSSPVKLSHNCTVKAIAMKKDMGDSKITVYAVNVFAVESPTFSLSGDVLTVTTSTENAKIYYTLGGAEPDAAANLYTTPIKLVNNRVVKAIAYAENLNPSTVAIFNVSIFDAAKPEFKFSNDLLTITCSTPKSIIYYTLDGNDPTEISTKYTTPIYISDNRAVKARAYAPDYNPSSVATYSSGKYACAEVIITVNGSIATLTTTTKDAVIYYTLDGTTPTGKSNCYTTPITLNHNCTIKAFATKPYMEDSDISVYAVNTFVTSTPTFDISGDQLSISCSTPGAEIHYTIGGATPSESSAKYNGAIKIEDNRTVKAIAYAPNFNPSAIASYTPNGYACGEVNITVSGGVVTMTSSTQAAKIYYTLDGSTPTSKSTLYDKPFVITHNCTIKAIATKDNLSDSSISTFVVSNFSVEAPTFNFYSGSIEILCSTPDAKIRYTVDGTTPGKNSKLYVSPFPVNKNCEVKAIAYADNFNPSPVVTYSVDVYVCDKPVGEYNGRYMSINVQPSTTVYYTLDGTTPSQKSKIYDGPFDVHNAEKVLMIAVRNDYRNSEVAEHFIEYYSDGEYFRVNAAGSLANACTWMPLDRACDNIYVEGNLNSADLQYISTFGPVKYLDISNANLSDNKLSDGDITIESLISLKLPRTIKDAGDKAFKGCPNIAAIVWNSDSPVPYKAIEKIENPNMLLYVKSNDLLPENRPCHNIVIGRIAEDIILNDVPNGNFYCPVAFTAGHISYKRDFSLNTIIGETCGWETIALPFDVENISHAQQGDITPFSPSTTNKKPFWLYGVENGSFSPASRILANTPYLISMPNDKDYADEYILGGEVVFAASNTNVPATECAPQSIRDLQFKPTTTAVRKSTDILCLNEDAYNGQLPGSVFVADVYDANPFEAYITNKENGYQIAKVPVRDLITDDCTSLLGLNVPKDGIVISVENSVVYIDCLDNRAVSVYSISGIRIKEVQLEAGRNVISDLDNGIYIIANQKVIVR